jgi:predicted NBD/HSP70 family sugar kinase
MASCLGKCVALSTSEILAKRSNLIRHVNASRCLRLLRRNSPLSRADIARELDITRTTAGKLVGNLIDEGLVREVARLHELSRVGRPGVLVELDPTGAYFLGLDVSSTSLAAVLIDFGASVVRRDFVIKRRGHHRPEAVAETLAEMARRLVMEAGVEAGLIRGVGLSVPGTIDHDGVVVFAPHLGWEDVGIRALLSRELGRPWPIRVCNDAVALAAAVGALNSPVAQNVLIILLSEGVGGAIVNKGQVFEGSLGFAGEVGHMILAPACDGRSSRTFGVLCGYLPFARFLPPGKSVSDALARLADRDDLGDVLEEVLANWAASLSVGFLNLIHVLNPDSIIVGGPLAVLYPRVAETVQSKLRMHLLHGFPVPSIKATGFDGDTLAIGAAAIERDAIFTLPTLDAQRLSDPASLGEALAQSRQGWASGALSRGRR